MLHAGHSEARHLYAIILLDPGRFDEAIAELTQTLVADPLLAPARMTLGPVHLSMGQLDLAIAALTEALELLPGFSSARGHLGHAYLLQGRTTEALAESRGRCTRARRATRRGWIARSRIMIHTY